MNDAFGVTPSFNYKNEFDYAVWSPGTTLTLSNVKWDSQYRNVVWFKHDNDLNHTLEAGSRAFKINKVTYCPVGQPVRVPIPFTTANYYNYLWVHNPSQPVRQGEHERNFYYFIQDVRYIAPNTTELILQLDVWQTYIRLSTLSKCYLQRGHMGISKTYDINNPGAIGMRDVLTEPEGLDIGSSYRISGAWDYDTFKTKDQQYNSGVVVASTTDLAMDGGSVDNPKLHSAEACPADGLISACALYYCPNQRLMTQWLGGLKQKPWLTQGIIGMWAVPKIEITKLGGGKAYGGKLVSEKHQVWMIQGTRSQMNQSERMSIPNFRNHNKNVKGRYKNLKKLNCYPYAAIEMTAYNGSSVLIKPEEVMNDSFDLNIFYKIFPPDQRIVAYPPFVGKYGIDVSSGKATIDLGINDKSNSLTSDFLANAIVIDNFPQLPFVNNQAALVLANSAHQRAWESQSADWAQSRAMMAAQNARDNAGLMMNAAADVNAIQMDARSAMTGVQNNTVARQAGLAHTQNLVSSGMGILGGALSLNPGQMVSSLAQGAMSGLSTAVNQGIQTDANNANLAIQNQLSGDVLARQQSAQRGVADANYALAQKAAQGDYANTLAGINAKVQDAKLTPPSMAGSYGGDAFNLGITHRMSIYVKLKVITEGPLHRVGEYFLRYGYTVNRWCDMPSDYLVMSKFTYWQVQDLIVKDSLAPQQYREAIKGMFERGLTVWADQNYINNVDWADNVPQKGKGRLYLHTTE